MILRIGQRVACIGTEGTPGVDWNAWVSHHKIILPSRGIAYTVRDSRIGKLGRQFIRLVEIVNPSGDYFYDAPPQEPWWLAEAFRPIVDRKTDIGFAHEILRSVKSPVRALVGKS